MDFDHVGNAMLKAAVSVFDERGIDVDRTVLAEALGAALVVGTGMFPRDLLMRISRTIEAN